MSSESPARWQRTTDRPLLQTRIFSVRASGFRHPARAEEKEFFVIDAPDWAVVAPMTAAGELVLVRQFRFGAEALSWELPGGVVEPGEDPSTTAARELSEETGYRGDPPIVLGAVHPNPAIQSNRAHFILITNVVRGGDTAWDVDEEIQSRLVPLPEVLRWARAGKITHALMLNLLFLLEPWWRDHGREGHLT